MVFCGGGWCYFHRTQFGRMAPRLLFNQLVWPRLFSCCLVCRLTQNTMAIFPAAPFVRLGARVPVRARLQTHAQACVSKVLIKTVWEPMLRSCSTAPISRLLQILPGNQAGERIQLCLDGRQQAGSWVEKIKK